MESYRKMYSQISNPLNDTNIKDILSLYFNDNNDLYSALTRVHINEKKVAYNVYYAQKRDAFYARMYEIWKTSILNMTDAQIENRIRSSRRFDNDFRYIKSYLQSIPNITTYKDFLKYTENQNNLIDKYGWHNFGRYSSWNHISSSALTSYSTKYNPSEHVEHRLYLNTESTDTEEITLLFMNKCLEKQLPFYFKYSESSSRDDTIVIYSSTEFLNNYIDVLKELKISNPEVFSRLHKPPVLTGVIDGYIGYGSEPKQGKNGQNQSFNEIRSRLITNIVDPTMYSWIDQNLKRSFTINKQTKTIQDLLIEEFTNKILEKTESVTKHFLSYSEGTNDNKLYQLFGLIPSDYSNPKYKEYIKRYIKKSLIDSSLIKNYSNSNFEEIISIPTREGKSFTFDSYYIDKTFKNFAGKYLIHSHDFISGIKDTVSKEAYKEGIDANNFCFDIDARNKLFSYDDKQKTQSSNDKINTDVEFNALTLCDNINPNLLNGTVTLSDNKKISTKDFLSKIVFKHIPEDGFFTLKNGERIPYYKFIEEIVLKQINIFYRGNIDKLLEENTVRNTGVINIINNNQINTIQSKDIIKYISSDLLQKMIRCPDGKYISIENYILKYFINHIPQNGIITLGNGQDVSIQKYIQKVISRNLPDKYNGNAFKLLQETTINNHGIVKYSNKREQLRIQKIKKDLIESEIINNDSEKQNKLK